MTEMKKKEIGSMTNRQLCIATYNIFHGQFVLDDVGIIGRELADLGADVVGLQEVDVKTARVGGMDTLRLIAEAGGYPYDAFAPAMELGGGEYGTAILSRYPILSHEVIPLAADGLEPRAVGHALIDLGGTRLDFFNTHLSVEEREARLCQILALRELTAPCERVLLTGDFNTEVLADFDALAPMKTVNPRIYPSYYPGKLAIDHIFYTEGFVPTDREMPQLPHSDHYPILARFAF